MVLKTLQDTLSCWHEYLGREISAYTGSLRRNEMTGDTLLLAWKFPPADSGGVFRPLSWARFFASQGASLTVLTDPRPTHITEAGRSLEASIPADTNLKRLPGGASRMPSHRFFPRVDRSMLSALDLVREAFRLYEGKRPKVVIATGPPFHSFVAGFWLARTWRVPLVLDYRDEWTECPFSFVQRGNADLFWERRTNAFANRIILVTQSQLEHHASALPEAPRDRMVVIPNGWEPVEQRSHPAPIAAKATELAPAARVTFAGTLGNHTLPDSFLATWEKALPTVEDTLGTEVTLQFVGSQSDDARRALESAPKRSRVVSLGLRTKSEAASLMAASDVLLIINTPELSRYIPGKLYDYLASRTPVIAYGEGGEIERILTTTGAGVCVPADNPAALAAAIAGMLTTHTTDEPRLSEWLDAHTRDRAAAKLLELVAEVSNGAASSDTERDQGNGGQPRERPTE